MTSPIVRPKWSGLRSAISSISMPTLGAGIDLRLEEQEREVEKQDRPGHAERVGNRVTHCRVVVAERRDGRLQRRRARPRTCEQAEGVAEIQAHRSCDEQAHDPRRQHADQRDQVGPAAGSARQAEDELLAVLDPHGIEEERETERPDHRRRHRLGCKPAYGECDEQHGTHAEREALDADLADEIADRDREEQRHQGLLLEQRPDEVHGRLLCLLLADDPEDVPEHSWPGKPLVSPGRSPMRSTPLLAHLAGRRNVTLVLCTLRRDEPNAQRSRAQPSALSGRRATTTCSLSFGDRMSAASPNWATTCGSVSLSVRRQLPKLRLTWPGPDPQAVLQGHPRHHDDQDRGGVRHHRRVPPASV